MSGGSDSLQADSPFMRKMQFRDKRYATEGKKPCVKRPFGGMSKMNEDSFKTA